MKINISKLKKEFKKNGYFIVKNFIQKKYLLSLNSEINNLKDIVKYYDKSNNLRRIEKIYDKGIYLIDLNKKITELLKSVFKKDFLIFKDKLNIKPPGGEGFFAHYDGIFEFTNSKNQKKKGWYEYGDFFVTSLIALDPCNKTNGALELAKADKGSFDKLLKRTKKNGSPALLKEIEKITPFKLLTLNIGDMVIFSNTCPHRSKINKSKKSRRIIYYTYMTGEKGSKYDQYFKDKDNSKNISKALSN